MKKLKIWKTNLWKNSNIWTSFCFRRSGTLGIAPSSKVDFNFKLDFERRWSTQSTDADVALAAAQNRHCRFRATTQNPLDHRPGMFQLQKPQTFVFPFWLLSEIWCHFLFPLNRIGRSPWSPIQGCLADRGVAASLFILRVLCLILSLMMIGVYDWNLWLGFLLINFWLGFVIEISD